MLVQVLYFVALATIIPIVSLLSTSALYDTVGLCTVTFDFLQIVGLLTVVLGIVVYRLRPEEDQLFPGGWQWPPLASMSDWPHREPKKEDKHVHC